MMNLKKEKIPEHLAELMCGSGLISINDLDLFFQTGDIRPVHSDGSCRQFFRIGLNGKELCLAVAPGTVGGNDLREARAAATIGQHLLRRGVPVPTIYGWDEKSGLILFEDLGDIRLQDLKKESSEENMHKVYKQVIDQLVHMQFAGIQGFETGWCWDTPRYDQELMIARESMYFLKAFWHDMLGREVPHGIDQEFIEIASIAADGCEDVFLHRDFQSRNIMIKDGLVRFIDYQGGRLGPPGYDLASLLIDPYATLSLDFQDELLSYYLEIPAVRQSLDIETFRYQYSFLALQRNLQIIGAYSFLSMVRKKVFFSEYITPALHMLQHRLGQSSFASFSVLRRMVDAAVAIGGVS